MGWVCSLNEEKAEEIRFFDGENPLNDISLKDIEIDDQ
jgi:hypothetical protein